MASWQTLYDADLCPPEILVGMWDGWLSRLQRGPTQAERVLVHTPMMELAHERRFAVSQSHHSLAKFQSEHVLQTGFFIDGMQQILDNSDHKDRAAPAETHAPYLIGLEQSPTNLSIDMRFTSFGSKSLLQWPPIEHILEDMVEPPADDIEATVALPTEDKIIADDPGNLSDGMYSEYNQHVKVLSKKSKERSHHKPRQLREVKCRKDPIRCALEHTPKCSARRPL